MARHGQATTELLEQIKCIPSSDGFHDGNLGNSIINFLGPFIQLIQNLGSLAVDFFIYWQNTFTGISIANDSLDSCVHKVVAISINAAAHRLLNLPLSTQAQDKEIETVQDMAKTD